jgi:hypothetical protein
MKEPHYSSAGERRIQLFQKPKHPLQSPRYIVIFTGNTGFSALAQLPRLEQKVRPAYLSKTGAEYKQFVLYHNRSGIGHGPENLAFNRQM